MSRCIQRLSLLILATCLATEAYAAQHGIHMYRAGSLTIENCVITNFAGSGMFIAGPASVRIANTVVHGNSRLSMLNYGIVLGAATATLDNVRMSDNGYKGLFVSGGIASVVNSESFGHMVGLAIAENGRLSVTGTLVSNNTVGIWVENAGGHAAVSRSAIISNGVGLRNDDGGTLETYGDNILRYNTTPIEGTITPVSGQ